MAEHPLNGFHVRTLSHGETRGGVLELVRLLRNAVLPSLPKLAETYGVSTVTAQRSCAN